MIELVRPTVDLSDSWWEMVDEFDGETIHGSSLRTADREVLRDPEAFEEWVDWVGRMDRRDEVLPEGRSRARRAGRRSALAAATRAARGGRPRSG